MDVGTALQALLGAKWERDLGGERQDMMGIFIFLPAVLFGDFPVVPGGQTQTPDCFGAPTVQVQAGIAEEPPCLARPLRAAGSAVGVVFWEKPPHNGLS